MPDNGEPWDLEPAELHSPHAGCGLTEVPLAHDVVPVENGTGLVAGHCHGNTLGHPGPDEVANDGTPEVVKLGGVSTPSGPPCRRFGRHATVRARWLQGQTRAGGQEGIEQAWLGLPMVRFIRHLGD